MRMRVRTRVQRREVRTEYVKRRKMETHLGLASAQHSELDPSQSMRLQTTKTGGISAIGAIAMIW